MTTHHETQYTAYIGLGSNLSIASNVLPHSTSVSSAATLTPADLIHWACLTLQQHPSITNITMSSLYCSKPMGPQDQPDYTNAVIRLTTSLPPMELLDICQHIEYSAGRERKRHWGERTLDLDIILVYQHHTLIEYHSERLILPHPGLLERDFVLVPLLELDPQLLLNGKPLAALPAAQSFLLNKLNAR